MSHATFLIKHIPLLSADDQLQDPRLLLSTIEQDMLCQALSNLKHLTALTLPTVANSQLLDTIATHLKLRSLDVSCSTNVTDYGLMSLIGDQSLSKNTLQQLYLDGTSVTTNGIMLLLANLQQLELLKSPSLERALDMIVSEKRSLNLTKITVGRFWDASDILQNIQSLCPKLVHLVLPNISLDQCMTLKNLNKLSDLAHLHIGQIKFDRLVPALATFGNKLLSFTFSNFVDTVDLSQIAKSCPHLECLGLNAG